MNTTYHISTDNLDSKIIEKIKRDFPGKDVIIDVYSSEKEDDNIPEITNPELISRIKDIEQGWKFVKMR